MRDIKYPYHDLTKSSSIQRHKLTMSLADKKNILFSKGNEAKSQSISPDKTISTSMGQTNNATSFLNPQNSLANKQKKLDEATMLAQQGRKHLETSLFQWSPDYLAASSYFERSAEAYKSIGDMENALSMYIESAHANQSCKTYAASAVMFSKAAQCTKNEYKAMELYLQAAEAWGIHGDIEKSAESYKKAAIIIEPNDHSKSLELFQSALNLIYPSNIRKEDIVRLHPIVLELCREYWNFLLRRELFSEALTFAYRLIPLYDAFESESSLHKTLCAISILQLKSGDVVAAHEVFLQDHLNRASYRASTECRLAENLIMSFVHLDIDALDTAKNSSDMRYIDNEVARVAKSLSLFAAKSIPSATKQEANFVQKATPDIDAIEDKGVETYSSTLIEGASGEDEIDLT